jgi:CheY-like chemotaxis protein
MINVDVTMAGEGNQAVREFEKRIANQECFTMVLMDLIMPVKNGFEATKEIREIEATHGLERTYICGFSAEVTSSM